MFNSDMFVCECRLDNVNNYFIPKKKKKIDETFVKYQNYLKYLQNKYLFTKICKKIRIIN